MTYPSYLPLLITFVRDIFALKSKVSEAIVVGFYPNLKALIVQNMCSTTHPPTSLTLITPDEHLVSPSVSEWSFDVGHIV